ncbi:hypothetical protein V8E55_007276 [Tylopilus felleus]
MAGCHWMRVAGCHLSAYDRMPLKRIWLGAIGRVWLDTIGHDDSKARRACSAKGDARQRAREPRPVGLARSGVREVEDRRTQGSADAMCADTRERASDLVSWREVASGWLKTGRRKGGAGNVHTVYYSMYIAGVRVWAKAPKGFSARSTIPVDMGVCVWFETSDTCIWFGNQWMRAYGLETGGRERMVWIPVTRAYGLGTSGRECMVWIPVDTSVWFGYQWTRAYGLDTSDAGVQSGTRGNECQRMVRQHERVRQLLSWRAVASERSRTEGRECRRDVRRHEGACQRAGELVRGGARLVEDQGTRSECRRDRRRHKRASELASWGEVASVRLKTGGCAVSSAECDLRKRGAGEALNAREPARWQGRDGGQEKHRQHRHLTHSCTDYLLGSHVPRQPRSSAGLNLKCTNLDHFHPLLTRKSIVSP